MNNARFNLENPYFDKKRISTIDYTQGSYLEKKNKEMRIEQFEDETFNDTTLIDSIVEPTMNRFKKI